MDQTQQPIDQAPSKWRQALAAVVLAGLTISVMWPLSGHLFIAPLEIRHLPDNSHVIEGLSAANASWAFSTFQDGRWQPLAWLSQQLGFAVFGPEPGAHHLISLLLHGLVAALLFCLLARVTHNLAVSWLGTAIFALHPLQVEAAAWVQQRHVLLAGLLALATLVLYLRYAGRPSRARYIAVFTGFCLCLLCGPTGLFLPVLMLLLDRPLGRNEASSKLLIEKIPLFFLMILAAVVNLRAASAEAIAQHATLGSLTERAASASQALVDGLTRIIWPRALCIYYPAPQHGWRQLAGAVLVIGALTALCFLLRRHRPLLFAGWLWYIVAVLVSASLMLSGRLPDSGCYLATMGLTLAGAGAITHVKVGRGALTATLTVALTVLTLLALLSWRQTQTWRDGATLFRYATEVTAGNARAHTYLGTLLAHQGALAEAAEQFEYAISSAPDFAPPYTNLGVVAAKLGRTAEAIEYLEHAIVLDPLDVDAHSSLGHVLQGLGRLHEAVDLFGEALRLNPDSAVAHRNYALALLARQMVGEAVPHLEQALVLNPDDARGQAELGQILDRLGRFEEAAAHYRSAIDLVPESADLHTLLGVDLVRLKKPDEALPILDRALELKPGHPIAVAARQLVMQQLERGD